MNDKEKCLSHLNGLILDIDCLDELKAYTKEANIFNILKLNHFEIRHSNMLAWLLNPNENHGLADRFLKKVLIYATNGSALPIMNGLKPIDVDLMDFDDAIVFREKDNIDILLVSATNKLVLAIENKVFSKEHDNQLERYMKTLTSSYGSDFRYVLVYLTPDRQESSDPENWVDMGYDFVKEQLEQLIHTCELKEKPKMYIEDYILTIRRHVVEDKEIKDICTRLYFKHKEAFDLIFENKPDFRSEISQFFNEYLSTHAEEYGIKYLEQSSAYSIIRFVPNDLLSTKNLGSGWLVDDYLVACEIRIDDPGIAVIHLLIGPAKEEFEHYRQELLDVAVENKNIFNVKGYRITNKWKTIDTFRFTKPVEDQNYDDSSDYLQTLKNEFTNYLTKKLPKQAELLSKVLTD